MNKYMLLFLLVASHHSGIFGITDSNQLDVIQVATMDIDQADQLIKYYGLANNTSNAVNQLRSQESKKWNVNWDDEMRQYT